VTTPLDRLRDPESGLSPFGRIELRVATTRVAAVPSKPLIRLDRSSVWRLLSDRVMRVLLVAGLFATACAAEPDDDSYDFADGKSDGIGGIAYGALAQAKVMPSFNKTVTGLSVMTATVMPPDAKAIRKQIAETRDYVDLFVYAYSDKHGDAWLGIRDELDAGYETIGAFKDLFDRQGITDPAMAVYDPAELAATRDAALAWTTDFRSHITVDKAYLSTPSQAKLYSRDRSDLSQFFWGATKLEPSLSNSGLKNMAKLTRDLLDKASGDYDAVLDLREIYKPSNQEKFHDFRKRIRSISRMPGYFPEIVDTSHAIGDELPILTDGVDRYGTLNDKITRYAHDPSKDLADEITADWKALRDWQKQNHFDDVLAELHDAIRK
jgi:hypothetical protein